jgi:hypothetical protein
MANSHQRRKLLRQQGPNMPNHPKVPIPISVPVEPKEPGIRKAFNIVAAIAGVFGLGLEMTGHHPYIGIVLMAISVAYGIFELSTSPVLTKRLSRPIRVLSAVLLAAMLSWFAWPRIAQLIKPAMPTQAHEPSQPAPQNVPNGSSQSSQPENPKPQNKKSKESSITKAQSTNQADPCSSGMTAIRVQNNGGIIENNEFHIKGNPGCVWDEKTTGKGKTKGNKIYFEQKEPPKKEGSTQAVQPD